MHLDLKISYTISLFWAIRHTNYVSGYGRGRGSAELSIPVWLPYSRRLAGQGHARNKWPHACAPNLLLGGRWYKWDFEASHGTLKYNLF